MTGHFSSASCGPSIISRAAAKSSEEGTDISPNYGFILHPVKAMHQVFLTLGILVAALIALPLLARRRDVLPVAQTKYYLLYFVCLGLGFMGIELGMMQQFSLFLGHPNYALVVVLAALLFFSSLGSLGSDRFKSRFAFWASRIAFSLVLLLCLCTFLVPLLLKHFIALPFSIKAVMTILIIAPQGFLMGMLYPWVLKRLVTPKRR